MAHITEDQLREFVKRGMVAQSEVNRVLGRAGIVAQTEPKQSKYHNVRTPLDGHVFDSKKEANRYLELKMAQKHGRIRNLRTQVAFALDVGNENIGKIVLDFVYEQDDGRTVYEDVKSDATVTPIFKWKARHFLAQYGATIELIK